MIDKIEKLIEKVRNKDYEAYEDLEYYLMQFSIQVANKKHNVDLAYSNMEFKKAEYQALNRDKHNSDRSCSMQFKLDNRQAINKLETIEAETKLLEAKMKAYERFANFYKSDEIRWLALNKRLNWPNKS